MDKQKVSVVVCCYNESERAMTVLNEIKKSEVVGEIVVVDDSSDEESRKDLTKVSGINLVPHYKREGKSKAMEIGVLKAKYDVIVFADADLFGFKSQYIDELAKPVIDGKLDLVLGDREKELWIGRLVGLPIILTGERAVLRSLLLENMEMFRYGGYLAEVAMNRLFFRNKRVGKVLFKGVGQYMKHDKYGISGLISDFKGLYKIIRFIGLKEFVWQIVFASRVKKLNY